MIKNDARYTRKIQSRIVKTKAAFNRNTFSPANGT